MYQLSEKSFALPRTPPGASPTSRPPSLLQLSPLKSPTIVERWRGGEVGGGGKNTGGGIRGYDPPNIGSEAAPHTYIVCVGAASLPTEACLGGGNWEGGSACRVITPLISPQAELRGGQG